LDRIECESSDEESSGSCSSQSCSECSCESDGGSLFEEEEEKTKTNKRGRFMRKRRRIDEFSDEESEMGDELVMGKKKKK
jgi:hypothetical protein